MSQMLLSLGLMSGTSLDGVDAALILTDGEEIGHFGPSLTRPYPEALRAAIRSLLGGQGPVEAWDVAGEDELAGRSIGPPPHGQVLEEGTQVDHSAFGH